MTWLQFFIYSSGITVLILDDIELYRQKSAVTIEYLVEVFLIAVFPLTFVTFCMAMFISISINFYHKGLNADVDTWNFYGVWSVMPWLVIVILIGHNIWITFKDREILSKLEDDE